MYITKSKYLYYLGVLKIIFKMNRIAYKIYHKKDLLYIK